MGWSAEERAQNDTAEGSQEPQGRLFLYYSMANGKVCMGLNMGHGQNCVIRRSVLTG